MRCLSGSELSAGETLQGDRDNVDAVTVPVSAPTARACARRGHPQPMNRHPGERPRVRLDGPRISGRSGARRGHCRPRGSDDVLAVAGDLGRRLGPSCTVIHAISLDDYSVDPDAEDWEAQAARVLQSQRTEVEVALTGVVPGWSYHAARGDPMHLIAVMAEEYDALMIITGRRGTGTGAALGRLLHRSVSRG